MDLDRQVTQRRRLAWGLLAGAALLLALAGLVYASRVRLLTAAADYLVVDDPLRPADAILLLNGDYNTRPFQAAALYRQGLAPLILVAQAEAQPAEALGLVRNDTQISIAVMEAKGVPADRIVLLPGPVTSTYDEAVALRNYAAAHPLHSVLLVTSAFHTRRADWIVTRELAGLDVSLEVSAVPYDGFDATNWWQSENGLIALNNEYVKLVYYYWKYR